MLKETAMLKPLASLLVLKRFQDHILTPLEKESGLTRIELDILHFLMENPSFNTATAIIDTNHFSKSHVSTALKHLESLNYVRKFADNKNKKITYLSLTDKAYDLADRVKLRKLEVWKSLVQGIPPEQLQVMVSTLEAISANAYLMEKQNPL